MTVASRQELISTAKGFIGDHSCKYGERLIDVDRLKQMGSYGYDIAVLGHHIDSLIQLHADGNCPPTHVGDAGPTRTWADWVQDTQA